MTVGSAWAAIESIASKSTPSDLLACEWDDEDGRGDLDLPQGGIISIQFKEHTTSAPVGLGLRRIAPFPDRLQE